MATKEEILLVESKLRDAMVQADVEQLDRLIHDDLLFTIPNGMVMGKSDDLNAYRNQLMKVEELTPESPVIRLFEDCAVVSVQTHLKGQYGDQAIDGLFRYQRTWKFIGRPMAGDCREAAQLFEGCCFKVCILLPLPPGASFPCAGLPHTFLYSYQIKSRPIAHDLLLKE